MLENPPDAIRPCLPHQARGAPQKVSRSAAEIARGQRNSFFWIDPQTGIAGLLATQTFPFADPRVMDLFYTFEQGVYRALA